MPCGMAPFLLQKSSRHSGRRLAELTTRGMEQYQDYYALIAIPVAYLLGSIPFSALIARLYGISDLRTVGSGNIGATNVWRAAGPFAGILALLADLAKGVVAVLFAMIWSHSFEPILPGILSKPLPYSIELVWVLAAFAVILGHVFPVFTRFKGGKGVATGLGAMITLMPIQTLIALGVFVVVVLISRFISLGSILAALAFATVLLVQRLALLQEVPLSFVVAGVALAVLVLATHTQNIRRLIRGDENRFSSSRKANSHG